MHADSDDFDFDEWVALAKGDPEAFEQRRTQLLQTAIRKAPDGNRSRLEGLQFQIDMIRQKMRHPMGACVKLSSMMFDQLSRELPLLMNSLDTGMVTDAGKKPPTAEVIVLESKVWGKKPSNCQRPGDK